MVIPRSCVSRANQKLADSGPRSQARFDRLGLAMGASGPTTRASFPILKA